MAGARRRGAQTQRRELADGVVDVAAFFEDVRDVLRGFEGRGERVSANKKVRGEVGARDGSRLAKEKKKV